MATYVPVQMVQTATGGLMPVSMPQAVPMGSPMPPPPSYSSHVASTVIPATASVVDPRGANANRPTSFRTALCRRFEQTGECPYLEKCMFAHGSAQLRTLAMNEADGLMSKEAVFCFLRAERRARRAAAAAGKQGMEEAGQTESTEVTAPSNGGALPANAQTVSTADSELQFMLPEVPEERDPGQSDPKDAPLVLLSRGGGGVPSPMASTNNAQSINNSSSHMMTPLPSAGQSTATAMGSRSTAGTSLRSAAGSGSIPAPPMMAMPAQPPMQMYQPMAAIPAPMQGTQQPQQQQFVQMMAVPAGAQPMMMVPAAPNGTAAAQPMYMVPMQGGAVPQAMPANSPFMYTTMMVPSSPSVDGKN